MQFNKYYDILFITSPKYLTVQLYRLFILFYFLFFARCDAFSTNRSPCRRAASVLVCKTNKVNFAQAFVTSVYSGHIALSELCPAGILQKNKSELEGEKGAKGGKNGEGRKASAGQFISV